MKLKYIDTFSFLLIGLAIVLLLDSCTHEPLENHSSKLAALTEEELTLNFYQNDNETKDNFETGLKWCFSFLGAQLQEGSWQASTDWLNDKQLKIDFSKLGFNEQALKNIKLLIQLIKQTEEFEITRGIDGGRFVVSVFNNSNHYYKIVGIPTSYPAFASNYQFLKKRAAIVESAVALGERIIQLPSNNDNFKDLGYSAEELSAPISDSNFIVEEREVMDVMPNGQLRFGIYNKNNELVGGADPAISNAGKPAKCLWCHEVNIQSGFVALTKIPGYYSPKEFDSIVSVNSKTLNNHRQGLSNEIDFAKQSQHVELEKLYIRFMEPSLNRLASEWNISESDVQAKLTGLTTHIYPEFPELGELYFRQEVQQFTPFKVLPTTSESRETVGDEPNLLP